MFEASAVSVFFMLSTYVAAITESNTLGLPCPSNASGVVYRPVVGECNAYWICQDGIVKKIYCPRGLHFNSKKNVCDVQAESNCLNITFGEDAYDRRNGFQHPGCPAINPPEPVILPHEHDCNKFYICDRGIAHEKTCLPGLHFNPELKVCDYPENAKCQSRLTDAQISERCPKRNLPLAKLLPHETDCHRYYICDSGKAHPRICPKGLHFSRRKHVCDYPEFAGCQDISGRDFFTTEDTDTTVREATGSPSPFCPKINGKHPIFYRHETNCSVYYMCGNGLSYEFTCPRGLHFNLKKKTCDVPHKAGCRRNKFVYSTATATVSEL